MDEHTIMHLLQNVFFNKHKSSVSVLLFILLPLLITVVMVVLNVFIKPSESGINTAGIITSFIAGMSGYATIEFLRRLYFE